MFFIDDPADDPAVKMSWESERLGELEEEEGRNYRLLRNNTVLAFTNVEKDNEGRYRCRVSL